MERGCGRDFQAEIEAHQGGAPGGDELAENFCNDFLDALDQGHLRVVEKKSGVWQVNTWVKEGILMCFRYLPAQVMGQEAARFYDKIPLKTACWDRDDFIRGGFRMVPGAVVRKGVYVAPGAVIMPSFMNIGAVIGPRTMVDSHVRVGSCAYVGSDCHLSDAVGLGGVLEPLQATPVIIEDGCFLGARVQVVEGVIVREGAVLGMGTTLGASTKIVDRETGAVTYGEIPPYAVVVPGSVGSQNAPHIHTDCAVIVKRVDAHTRAKVAINDLLRG